MQSFNLHPEFHNQSIWLSKKEQETLIFVIKGSFEYNSLTEVRQHLASILEVCLTTANSLYIDFDD